MPESAAAEIGLFGIIGAVSEKAQESAMKTLELPLPNQALSPPLCRDEAAWEADKAKVFSRTAATT